MKFFLAVAGGNLWQFRARNVLSVTIICLSFLIVGIFLALSNNLRHMARQLESDMSVTFFLQKGAPAPAVAALEAEIRRAPFVSEVRLVTAEEARQRFETAFPELRDILTNLGANPFPAALEARVENAGKAAAEIPAFIDRIRVLAGVEDVQFNQDWVEKMNALGRLARAVGFFLGGILVLASFFIISNVIKLNVYSRRGEIDILRLVGATNLYIRVPFWLEGTALGLLGSGLSILLLIMTIEIFPLYIGPSLGGLREFLQFRFLTSSQSLTLLAGGAAIGFLGSASSVSKFLKT